jgi:hypothetical protein
LDACCDDEVISGRNIFVVAPAVVVEDVVVVDTASLTDDCFTLDVAVLMVSTSPTEKPALAEAVAAAADTGVLSLLIPF